MRGIITAPKNVITGAFTMHFSFVQQVELSMADIDVETIDGDALGNVRDSFGGSGANYHILCYLPDMRAGISLISVKKSGISVDPVLIQYDTIKFIFADWGTPIERGDKIEIPLTLDTPVQILKKRNFKLSRPVPFQLYGSGKMHSLVLPARENTIEVYGTVRKHNGIDAIVHTSILEI